MTSWWAAAPPRPSDSRYAALRMHHPFTAHPPSPPHPHPTPLPPTPSPPAQVVCNYVAMTPQGKVFDSSLDRGTPYNFRVGTGDVVPGEAGAFGVEAHTHVLTQAWVWSGSPCIEESRAGWSGIPM